MLLTMLRSAIVARLVEVTIWSYGRVLLLGYPRVPRFASPVRTRYHSNFYLTEFSSTPPQSFLFIRYKRYAREHPNIKAFDALRLAFATGLLNQKRLTN